MQFGTAGLSSGETAGLAAFVGLGLVGSVHCLGMCGPLVTTYADRLDDGGPVSGHEIRQHALFNAGRTLSYALVGTILGAAGGVLYDVAGLARLGTVVRGAVGRLSSDAYADYVAGVIERFVGDVQTVATDSRAFLRVGLTSVLIWTIDVATALVVLAAFGYELSITLIAVGFFAVSVGNLAKVLPLTPGGVGLYEGAFALIVASLTPITAVAALGVAVVDHMVKNVVTIAGGLASMAWLNVSLTSAVEESRQAGEMDGSTASDGAGPDGIDDRPTPSTDDT